MCVVETTQLAVWTVPVNIFLVPIDCYLILRTEVRGSRYLGAACLKPMTEVAGRFKVTSGIHTVILLNYVTPLCLANQGFESSSAPYFRNMDTICIASGPIVCTEQSVLGVFAPVG